MTTCVRIVPLPQLGLFLLSAALSLAVCEGVVRAFVTVRDVGPSFTVYDPALGQRLKASFHAVRYTPEFTMTFSTNSLGRRGPEPAMSREHPILFLGDSFTMGYGVNDGEEFPALVAAELARRGHAAPAVVNLGIGDSGQGVWVKLLRDEAPRLEPRLVVFQMFWNDPDDNLRERLFTLDPSGALRELAVPPPGVQRRVQTAIELVPGLNRLYLIGLLRQLSLRGAQPPPGPSSMAGPAGGTAPPEPGVELTTRLVAESLEICRRNGWPSLALLAGLSGDLARAAHEVFARSGVEAIDIPGQDERPDLYYAVDVHWNAAGHRYVASRLVERLATR